MYIKEFLFSIFILLFSISCGENNLGTKTGLVNATPSESNQEQADCYEQAVLSANPVVYFRFNEESGASSVQDLGSANNSPIINSVVFGVAGALNRASGNSAVRFNGSASLNLQNLSYLQITGSQTIEFWLRPTNFSTRRNPFAKAYGGEGTMTIETNRQINYYYGTSGGNTSPYGGYGSTSTLTLNTWTHVALVRDLGSMRVRWYFNGAQVSSRAASHASATAGSNNLTLGEGYVANYIGDMDEFALYDTALSAAEVLDHYEKGSTACP